jgi:D-alanyl-D-alanine dipeptidase
MTPRRQGRSEPVAALNRVKLIENHEPLVDLREVCPRIGLREGILPYLRRTVAGMLNEALERLPAGHGLRLHTALRTIEMQKRGWDGYRARLQQEHPDWPTSALNRCTNRFFAPYDQPAPPGHCTGGAVDVALIGPDGEQIAMMPTPHDWALAPTDCRRVPKIMQQYRRILYQAMTDVGFSNFRDEYWHYSYGDASWAVRTGRDTCCYGLVMPPE